MSKARKCTKPECENTHNVLLHGADHLFSSSKEEKSSSGETPAEKSTPPCSQGYQLNFFNCLKLEKPGFANQKLNLMSL